MDNLDGNNNSFPPSFRDEKHTVAIDFDGVIHNDYLGYHNGTIYGEPIEGALDAVKSLASNFKIVIFTAKAKPDRPLIEGRTGKFLVWKWLFKHGIADYVADVTAEKPRALIYIDDKGYRFENWNDTLKFVECLNQKK